MRNHTQGAASLMSAENLHVSSFHGEILFAEISVQYFGWERFHEWWQYQSSGQERFLCIDFSLSVKNFGCFDFFCLVAFCYCISTAGSRLVKSSKPSPVFLCEVQFSNTWFLSPSYDASLRHVPEREQTAKSSHQNVLMPWHWQVDN